MKIEISIENMKIRIILMDHGKKLDSFQFEENHCLSEKLLSSLDKLLQKNSLSVSEIKFFDLKSDIQESFISFRIAQSVVNALNWANKWEKWWFLS